MNKKPTRKPAAEKPAGQRPAKGKGKPLGEYSGMPKPPTKPDPKPVDEGKE